MKNRKRSSNVATTHYQTINDIAQELSISYNDVVHGRLMQPIHITEMIGGNYRVEGTCNLDNKKCVYVISANCSSECYTCPIEKKYFSKEE